MNNTVPNGVNDVKKLICFLELLPIYKMGLLLHNILQIAIPS